MAKRTIMARDVYDSGKLVATKYFYGGESLQTRVCGSMSDLVAAIKSTVEGHKKDNSDEAAVCINSAENYPYLLLGVRKANFVRPLNQREWETLAKEASR